MVTKKQTETFLNSYKYHLNVEEACQDAGISPEEYSQYLENDELWQKHLYCAGKVHELGKETGEYSKIGI